MITGTFPKIGTGVSPQDAKRPDFTSLGFSPQIWELISETGSTMTVSYQTQ
jgi:hypothetical protein